MSMQVYKWNINIISSSCATVKEDFCGPDTSSTLLTVPLLYPSDATEVNQTTVAVVNSDG